MAVSINGSVTLSHLDDKDMVVVFEHKAKHEGLYAFNPQAMRSEPVVTQQAAPGRTPQKVETLYANVTLSWGKPEGLSSVIDLLQKLHNHRHQTHEPVARQA